MDFLENSVRKTLCGQVDESIEYRIEKTLKRRTKNKRKEVLVCWLVKPEKYDSWIPEEDLKDYS